MNKISQKTNYHKSNLHRDPLAVLDVISSLEVGPVHLERNRMTMPYKVVHGHKADSINLVYKFEEDVFKPDESSSINLAEIIGAQVALNYGLFCKKIIFNGTFDKHDRRFIVDMAENTAREIYVKKFLEPNPFLIGQAAHVPALKRKSYLRSKIIFKMDKSKAENIHWNTNQLKYAVLSSGGKDSLLSFGLLNEMGFDTHPIYINESGRHWFTALNAYRHFRQNYPNTARVWTNADRVFNWMLHQLPFVRQDFARFRADEYPIRLWTVAVFIFGALPLIRKRGIGRIIIGNEYDTTRKMNYMGIPHYDGLYDQSRYFDNALTRYYRRKGWGLIQFSFIRPLAELSIQNILAKRYPQLQHHQVSCHAAHIANGRVLPCGDCEKCRRIVGMLMALGANPTHCGYTRTQIARVLTQLSSAHLRQDAASAEHLAFLLEKKRLIHPAGSERAAIREHSQISKMMFDNEKSIGHEIPSYLKKKLFSIYLKYADGIVVHEHGIWVDRNIRRVQ